MATKTKGLTGKLREYIRETLDSESEEQDGGSTFLWHEFRTPGGQTLLFANLTDMDEVRSTGGETRADLGWWQQDTANYKWCKIGTRRDVIANVRETARKEAEERTVQGEIIYAPDEIKLIVWDGTKEGNTVYIESEKELDGWVDADCGATTIGESDEESPEWIRKMYAGDDLQPGRIYRQEVEIPYLQYQH